MRSPAIGRAVEQPAASAQAGRIHDSVALKTCPGDMSAMAIPCARLVPDQHPVRAQLMAAGAPLGRKHHPAALGAWDDITNAGHGVQDRADPAGGQQTAV